MTADNKKKDAFQLAAFRLPKELHTRAIQKCKEEELTFSQLTRRAIKKELERIATAKTA